MNRRKAKRLAEKLLPVLDGNLLASLPPESLALVLRTSRKDLERLTTFLKEDRGLAAKADSEIVEYVQRLLLAREVINS